MQKVNKHIEIVRSNVKSLSSMSQESCESLFAVLSRNYSHVGVTIINECSDLENIRNLHPDLVFLGMEYVPRKVEDDEHRKIWLSDYLDGIGVAYTGSAKPAHRLGRNKSQAKQRMIDGNVRTAQFEVIKKNQEFTSSDIHIPYPIFIKPTDGGGGFGIDSKSLVHNFEQLSSKVDYISHHLKCDSLLEQYLLGHEFSVAILKDIGSGYLEAMPLELIAPVDEYGTRILSNAVKKSNAEDVRSVEDSTTKAKVCELALEAFNALGARDYGRIDIRMDSEGAPHFLEANLIPSLISGYGSFPKACSMNISLEYEPMILSIVTLAMERSEEHTTSIPELSFINNPIFSN